MQTNSSSWTKWAVTLAMAGVTSTYASSDYGPAIWNPACSGHWYTTGYGHKFHVVHDMEGYYLTTISYFQNCGTSASVHYCVNGKQDTSTDHAAGEITQMVLEANYAWHVLCWNQFCTGTEHEGFASNPSWYTEALYQASSGISRHEADKFGYAKDRNHIVGHNEWQNANWRSYAGSAFGINTTCNTHTDPGSYWDWSHYMSLINGATSNPHINPCIARNSDGRLELFAVGKTGNLYHIWQSAANAGWTTTWANLSGTWAQNVVPGVAKNSDGRLEIFVIGTTGQMYHAYEQTAGNSSSWSGWGSLGGSFNQTATVNVGVNQDGRLEIFAVGAGGDLQHNYQNTPGGSWAGWSTLGGSWSQNADVQVVANSDGRLELFMVGGTSQMYHSYQTAPNSGWTGWSSLAGTFGQDSRFSAIRNSDGRLELFAISTAGDLQHAYQTTPGGVWYSWPSLGGSWSQSAQPVAGVDPNGTSEVLVIGSTGQMYHDYQISGTWSGWLGLGNSFSQDIRPCLGVNLDGRLEVFTTAPTSDMVHAYQNTANGTSWTGWPTLGGSWN